MDSLFKIWTIDPTVILVAWLPFHSMSSGSIQTQAVLLLIVSDQPTVNMKGLFALLFAAFILFVATEAAPSSKLHDKASEDKWVIVHVVST